MLSLTCFGIAPDHDLSLVTDQDLRDYHYELIPVFKQRVEGGKRFPEFAPTPPTPSFSPPKAILQVIPYFVSQCPSLLPEPSFYSVYVAPYSSPLLERIKVLLKLVHFLVPEINLGQEIGSSLIGTGLGVAPSEELNRLMKRLRLLLKVNGGPPQMRILLFELRTEVDFFRELFREGITLSRRW